MQSHNEQAWWWLRLRQWGKGMAGWGMGIETDSRGKGYRCVGERVGMETASWWGGEQRMRSVSTHLGRLNHISPIIIISSDLQICAVVWFALWCFCTWLCVSGAPGPRSVVEWEVLV